MQELLHIGKRHYILIVECEHRLISLSQRLFAIVTQAVSLSVHNLFIHISKSLFGMIWAAKTGYS